MMDEDGKRCLSPFSLFKKEAMTQAHMKRTIRILHLRSSGGFYGAESVILNASHELNLMGCENHICCINNFTNPHAELRDEAQKIGVASSSVDAASVLDRDTIGDIRQRLLDGAFDILHCHDYKASLYGLLASKGLPIRRVVTNHGWIHTDLKLRLYETLEGFLYNLFDRVVTVSEVAKTNIRRFLIHRSKIEVIENGVDCARFAPLGDTPGAAHSRSEWRHQFGVDDNDCVVGIVGRLSPEKGHEYLLQAIALLLTRDKGLRLRDDASAAVNDVSGAHPLPSLKLLVVGDGPLDEHLKDFCQQWNLPFVDLRERKTTEHDVAVHSAVVIFAGVQTDMPAVYHAIDCLVMPSLEEGLPMALLEAMAAGVPVAATPVGHIPQIVHDGETGWLFEPRNASDLAQVLQKMYMPTAEQRRQVQTMTANARALVEQKYSAHAMAKKYLEVYEWLAE